MKLIWHGHACFQLQSAEGNIVFDPYERNYLSGLELPDISADAVICSHRHGDHSAAELINLSGLKCGAKITQIPCFHDEVCGAKRGANLISIAELEGRRIVHMGDIGHMLNEEQVKALQNTDILLIPVGGVYTVDAKGAAEICRAVKPRVIVPMHYRGEEKGLRNVAPVDDFLSMFPAEKIIKLAGNVLDADEAQDGSVTVFNWP